MRPERRVRKCSPKSQGSVSKIKHMSSSSLSTLSVELAISSHDTLRACHIASVIELACDFLEYFVGAQEPNSPEMRVPFPVQLPGSELPPEKLHTSMK